MDWFLYDNGLRLERVKHLLRKWSFFAVIYEVCSEAAIRGCSSNRCSEKFGNIHRKTPVL